MEDNPSASQLASPESRMTEKKEYRTPELADYGDLRELTQTTQTVSSPDTAGFGLEVTAGV